MNRCLKEALILEYITKGKRTLIQRDPGKETVPNNYRQITCLQIRDGIYFSLTTHGLFTVEKKRCRKEPRGSGELLYIDQHTLDAIKTRQKSLAMVRID